MDYKQNFNFWKTDTFFDESTREELINLEKQNNETEIKDRFYKELEFGTGGLRGIMGAGTNRMNKYTVGKATFGFGMYIKNKYSSTVYIGFFIIGFYKNIEKYRKSLKFIVVFILAFIIVFPAINTFRIHKFSDVKIMNVMANVTKDITKNYLSEDYDAFSIVIDTDKYVKDNGISSGKQFLGAMLFFIPRNIWKNKPFGSGQTMFMVFKQKFTNISCPLLAEGYINFGIVGIILFAIITGFIIEIVDRKYWGNVDKNGITYDYLTILYPFLLGGYFFMLRGDLMSTWGYMFVYIFIFYILNKIQKKKCD